MIALKEKGNKVYGKEFFIVNKEKFFSKIEIEIINLLLKTPLYPKKVAKILKKDSQEIYYYFRRLKEKGIIEEIGRKEIKGGVATLFKVKAPSMLVPFNDEWKEISKVSKVSKKLEEFFYPIIKDRILNGYIVVGSPVEHGRYFAKARDGHYAIELALLLGKFCNSKDFSVKLDTEIINENKLKENLILIGGPGTNVVSEKINKCLPIKFDEDNFWKGLFYKGKSYFKENLAVIEKIKNPFDKKKAIIILAGLKNQGTLASIIAITKFYSKVLRDYKNEPFYKLIEGLDINGDGIVDSIRVVL